MKKFKSRHYLAGGMFAGLTISASALAIQSAPTPTVVGRAPVVAGAPAGEITITDTNSDGVLDTGDVLTIDPSKLTQTDADGDAHTEYDYTWSVGGTDQPGTTATSYTIKAADLGKSITLKVIGKTNATISDPAESAAYTAQYVANAALGVTKGGTVTVAEADDVASAVISGFGATGSPVVGTVLTVTVTMADGKAPGVGKVDYQWKIEDGIGSGSYMNITRATSSTYTPGQGDQKKHIMVVVTRHGASSAGTGTGTGTGGRGGNP